MIEGLMQWNFPQWTSRRGNQPNNNCRTERQTWGDYKTNVIDFDYDYLPPARLRLRLPTNKIPM